MIEPDDKDKLLYHFTFSPLGSALERTTEMMEEFFYRWEGTPYRNGWDKCQVGCDCLRFFVAFLTEAQGFRMPHYDTLPPDSFLHDKVKTMAVMKSIMKCYGPAKRVYTKNVEPGDFLIEGKVGPGHVRIVGTKPGQVWEATPVGVRRTGLMVDGVKLHAIYRHTAKDKWFK